MQSLSTGESPVVCARLPQDLVDRMDQMCAIRGLSRSAYLRESLDYTLTVDSEELESGGK